MQFCFAWLASHPGRSPEAPPGRYPGRVFDVVCERCVCVLRVWVCGCVGVWGCVCVFGKVLMGVEEEGGV